MLSSIARHLMSSEYGPFDRLLELGVFALIAYEVVVGIVRHRRAAKRQRELDDVVRTLSDFIFKGQCLQQNVPDPNHTDWAVQEPWLKSVAAWSIETSQFLSARSQRASAAFLLVTDSSSTDRVVIKLEGSSICLFGVIRERYQMLLVQLNNLRSIMEKPEVYF